MRKLMKFESRWVCLGHFRCLGWLGEVAFLLVESSSLLISVINEMPVKAIFICDTIPLPRPLRNGSQ